MTTTPPTNQQLDEIAARAEAATRGPWGFYDGDNYAEVAADMQVTSPGSCNYRERVARLEDEDYWDDQEHDGDDEERAPEQMAANAAFIAHAREDVPALLAALRDSRIEVEKLIRWHREDETAMKRMRTTIERLRGELAARPAAVAAVAETGGTNA